MQNPCLISSKQRCDRYFLIQHIEGQVESEAKLKALIYEVAFLAAEFSSDYFSKKLGSLAPANLRVKIKAPKNEDV